MRPNGYESRRLGTQPTRQGEGRERERVGGGGLFELAGHPAWPFCFRAKREENDSKGFGDLKLKAKAGLACLLCATFARQLPVKPWSPPSQALIHTTPYTLHPTPYTLHPTPYTLHLSPYTLHPTHYTLRTTPYTLHPTFCILQPTPDTLHPEPYTLHPTP